MHRRPAAAAGGRRAPRETCAESGAARGAGRELRRSNVRANAQAKFFAAKSQFASLSRKLSTNLGRALR